MAGVVSARAGLAWVVIGSMPSAGVRAVARKKLHCYLPCAISRRGTDLLAPIDLGPDAEELR
jgi:hypothetical protein